MGEIKHSTFKRLTDKDIYFTKNYFLIMEKELLNNVIKSIGNLIHIKK